MKKFIEKIKQNINIYTKTKLIAGFVLMGLVVADLGSKFWADDILRQGSINIIDGFFSFRLAYNTGVSFSMFNNLASGAIILAIFAICAGIFLEFCILATTRKIEIWAYALIASGAYGNGIDRIINGHVIDFLDFYYKNWHYPTFNLADCFIVIGVVILLLEGLFTKKA